MQDHDARYEQGLEQRDDVLAVRPAVDAVLVLHDHHIEAVKDLCCRGRARRGPVEEVMHDLAGQARRWLVEHAHDGYTIARPGQLSEQGRAERRQPALRGGIGAEQGVGRRHAIAPCRLPRRTTRR